MSNLGIRTCSRDMCTEYYNDDDSIGLLHTSNNFPEPLKASPMAAACSPSSTSSPPH